MALPKKRSKSILVDNCKYKYFGFINHYEGENYGELIIELFDNPRMKVKTKYTWEKVSSEFRKVNKKIGKFDTFPPYLVHQTILFALKMAGIRIREVE